MIYLLSQIVLALILAAVVGGALGWLLHRTTQLREAGQLRNAIQRQRQQVAQLNSEIAMLTDDYDELQRQSHDEITELREANQQIPRLNSNLEKSQLLVSQMIKRHESQIRDLNTQNQTLTRKLKDLEAQEQTLKRQQADLDSARRELGITEPLLSTVNADTDGELENTTQIEASSSEPEIAIPEIAIPEVAVPEVAVPEVAVPAAEVSVKETSAPQPVITSTRNVSSWASAPIVAEDTTNAADSNADVDVSADADAGANQSVSAGADIPVRTPVADQTPGNSSVIFLNADAPQHELEARTARSTTGTVGDDSELDPFDQVIEIDDQLLHEIDSGMNDDEFLNELDDAVSEQEPNDDDPSSFEPVEQQDDLQQIGGIGPATEKALNELGITSYAQLAKLKHHEIETIANALQIVPDSIERDDWVGNARRQLEDVLEEL